MVTWDEYAAHWMRGFQHGWESAMKAVRGEPFYHPEHPSSTPSRAAIEGVFVGTPEPQKRKRSKRKDPKKSKAMKMAQKKARLKSGKFRKGWGKSKLMKEYHRILKRL